MSIQNNGERINAGAMEAAIRAAWVHAVGIAPGEEDDFFETGGDSLLAVNFISAINRELGVEVPLVSIFDNPVYADFVRLVTDVGGRMGGDDQPPARGAA
jgi:phthiocerol/phenolphthiocerol synthesis type-I polyketide synthase E